MFNKFITTRVEAASTDRAAVNEVVMTKFLLIVLFMSAARSSVIRRVWVVRMSKVFSRGHPWFHPDVEVRSENDIVEWLCAIEIADFIDANLVIVFRRERVLLTRQM